MLELASIEKQITPDYPPTFVWCGLNDQTVDPENSKLLVKALEANVVPYRFTSYENVDHGAGLGEGLPCEGWLEKAVELRG